MTTSTRTSRLRQILLMQMREELGRRIAQARDDADLTQEQLAELIGVEYGQSVSNYERGVSEPGRKRLRKIAEATKKPISYFVDEETMVPETAVAQLGRVLEEMEARLLDRFDALDRRFAALDDRLAALEQQAVGPGQKGNPGVRRATK